MKRRSFLKGALGLASVPVAGLAAVRPVDVVALTKSKCDEATARLGIDLSRHVNVMGRGPYVARKTKISTSGNSAYVEVEVEYVSAKDFYIDQNEIVVARMGRNAGASMNNIATSIYKHSP